MPILQNAVGGYMMDRRLKAQEDAEEERRRAEMRRQALLKKAETLPQTDLGGGMRVSAAFRTPAMDRMQFQQEARASGEDLVGSLAGRSRGMSISEQSFRMQDLEQQVQQFDERMQALDQTAGRMDPIAKDQYNAIQKRHRGLLNGQANGRLSPLEIAQGKAILGRELAQFNWKTHIKGPGSQPGDIFEDQERGFIMHNIPGKGPTPIGYTRQHIEQNTYTDPVTGLTYVPTVPGKPPEVYKPSDLRDYSAEDKQRTTLKRELEAAAKDIAGSAEGIGKSQDEIAALAQQRVEAINNVAERMMAKTGNREGRLSDAQKQRQIQEEQGKVAPELSGGIRGIVSQAQEKQQAQQAKAQQKVDAENDKTSKKTVEVIYSDAFGLPKGAYDRARLSGYEPRDIIIALATLKDLQEMYPNIDSVDQLPEHLQAPFDQSMSILRALKGQ